MHYVKLKRGLSVVSEANSQRQPLAASDPWRHGTFPILECVLAGLFFEISKWTWRTVSEEITTKGAANVQRRFAFSRCRGPLLYLSELSDRFPDTRWRSRGPVIVKSWDVYRMERGGGAVACLVRCTAAALWPLLRIKKKENHLPGEWEERRVDWVLWGCVDRLFFYNCMSQAPYVD